jgi:hypothetical protein
MSLPKVPNPSQVVLELPPGYEGSGDPRPRSAEPTAVILASDILRWLIPKVGKFPKNVRFGLGARLEAAHFDVLEELIRAQYARGGGARAAALETGNTRLQSARHLARMARELNLLSEDSALHLARMQVDLGNQVGAWRRASVATANSSAPSATATSGSMRRRCSSTG